MSLATHSQCKSTNTQWEYSYKWQEKGKEDEEEENQIVEAPKSLPKLQSLLQSLQNHKP